MKNKISCMVLVQCLLFAMINCGTPSPPKEQLKDSGLFGEHSLMRIKSFGAVQGSISGNFFLGIGSTSSKFKIQFHWSPKPDEIIITSFPYSKFRFIIDETKNTPTIEFIFNQSWLNKETIGDYSEGNIPNLNDFFLSSNFELAKVRISKSVMEKEVYLPKIR